MATFGGGIPPPKMRSAMHVTDFLDANTIGNGKSQHWGDSELVPSVESIIESTSVLMEARRRERAREKSSEKIKDNSTHSGIPVAEFLKFTSRGSVSDISSDVIDSKSLSSPRGGIPIADFLGGISNKSGDGNICRPNEIGIISEQEQFLEENDAKLISLLKQRALLLNHDYYKLFKKAVLMSFADIESSRSPSFASTNTLCQGEKNEMKKALERHRIERGGAIGDESTHSTSAPEGYDLGDGADY